MVIGNRRQELTRVVTAVDQFASQNAISHDVVSDLQVAISEILTNILDYGYTDAGEHNINIRMRLADDAVEVTITDDGIPFNPLSRDLSDVRMPLDARRIGGLGIHFVRNLMNEVRYHRLGNHNCLMLRRNTTI